MMRLMGILLTWVIGVVFAFPVAPARAQAPAAKDYTKDPLQLLLDCRAKQDKISGFVATFTKRERIKGELRETEVMLMKCRYSPFSVYFKWQKGMKNNREVLYREGMYENKLVGHQPPLPFNVKVDPNSQDALKESLRPVTMAGFRHVLDSIIKVSQEAKQAGDLRMFCVDNDMFNGRPAYCMIRILPRKPNYPYFLLYAYIDKELMVPVHIATFDWNDDLVSAYTFSDVKLNPTFTEDDFDTDNPKYGFAKDPLKTLFGGKKR